MASAVTVGVDKIALELEIAGALGKATGESASTVLQRLAAHPSHDLAVPSPKALTAIGTICGRYGITVEAKDIRKTKVGEPCSFNRLVNMLEQKLNEKTAQ